MRNSVISSPCITFVAVGPGDPSLLTLAAVEAIKKSNLVAYPIAKQGGESIAAKIAAPWIDKGQEQLPILFPMVSDAQMLRDSWQKAGEKLVTLVSEGKSVALLCQGDISLFSSSSYVLLYIKENYPELPLKLIPGITSYAAAAANSQCPLAMQKEQLLILPTPDEPKELEAILKSAAYEKRVIALLKVGHRWSWVRPLLERMDLLTSAIFSQNIGLEDQQTISAKYVEQEEKTYFSLLLIRQSWPAIMPSKNLATDP